MLYIKILVWLSSCIIVAYSVCSSRDLLLLNNRSISSCKSVLVKFTGNSSRQMLEGSGDSVIMNVQFPSSWTDLDKGNTVDSFLAPHPWWIVIYERYNWSTQNDLYNVDVKLMRMSSIEKPLQALATIQFPKKCTSNQLHVRCVKDFNEYGNELVNIQRSLRKGPGTIFDVFTPGNAHWVHDSYCPNTPNKVRCAFLPATNCTSDIRGQCKDSLFFSSGSSLSDEISEQDFSKIDPRQVSLQKEIMRESKSFRLVQRFNFSAVDLKIDNYNLRGDMFYIAHLFRMNHDYRSRVAEMIAKFRENHDFGENAECIAFQIRRGDRLIHNRNMLEHCQHIRNVCGKDLKNLNCLQIKHDYYGLGCHTAHPYGALNFGMYVKAAELLVHNVPELKDVRNIVVMTNDEKWAVHHSANYTADWKFFVLPQPPHFRGSSVHHGVVNQMHLELTRQCSSFVAHMGSAFAVMVSRYMCFRHGPRSRLSFGKCPIFFDFSETFSK